MSYEQRTSTHNHEEDCTEDTTRNVGAQAIREHLHESAEHAQDTIDSIDAALDDDQYQDIDWLLTDLGNEYTEVNAAEFISGFRQINGQ